MFYCVLRLNFLFIGDRETEVLFIDGIGMISDRVFHQADITGISNSSCKLSSFSAPSQNTQPLLQHNRKHVVYEELSIIGIGNWY